ncbi:hypothetical protein DTL42_00615 [Bremerella cremea]|uniref:Uncharacterized protein n=1 Tax=Bremerella cremea TaxID=1031537 RepID=A0A368KZ76_9BACT|nr:hypothetical protein DTL42_00615 [Bremerella cremea]
MPSWLLLLHSISAARASTPAHGFYTNFRDLPPGRQWDRPPINDWVSESPDLEYGGGCLLWLEVVAPSCLEIYAHGHDFPQQISFFSLSPWPANTLS